MSKDERIKQIAEKAAPVFEKYGVEYAGLFGSYARGNETEESDIDILIRRGSKSLSLFDFISIAGLVMKFSDFENDRKTQSSVIMQLQVIGELVKKIPEDIKSSINLPWKKMAGMRDMVAHDYFSLDLEAVWNTVTKDIPELAKDINKYLMNA